MSVANLAARLDRLDAVGCFVTESDDIVTVSNVPMVDALSVAADCRALGWSVSVEDAAATEWLIEDLDDAFAPFTLIVEKPVARDGLLRLLTNVGLVEWLARDDDRRSWQLGRLGSSFETHGILFSPWGRDEADTAVPTGSRNARRLVRQATGRREVPTSMNRWLLTDREAFPEMDEAAGAWAAVAARKLALALPDEMDGERQVLRFKGPPRLDLRLPPAETDMLAALGRAGFLALQEAVDWTFEVEREAEMRHILLATEFARCGGSGDAADAFLKENAADALAGARTAYQIQLAGLSSDALKTLSELRRSVSDDTAKVADGTRQIITAVAGALAVGAGLLAARSSGSVNPTLIQVVLALAAVYVAITIVSGVLFTLLQRQVRRAWQPRLYRFLTKADYESLVGGPARSAERALWISSALGVVAIVLMLFTTNRVEAPTRKAERIAAPEREDDRPGGPPSSDPSADGSRHRTAATHVKSGEDEPPVRTNQGRPGPESPQP